jgi:hypothetical protein
MSKLEIIIYGFALIGIIGVIIAFIKTPKEQWFGLPKHEKEEGVDYAPEYTKKERIVIMFKNAAWALPLFVIAKFWFFDWLSEYSKNAHCYNYGNINGVHLVFYGLFVFMPLSFAAALFLTEGLRGIKVIKLGQFPLPNEKTFRPTKYRYGIAAKIQPIGIFASILLLTALSVLGGFQAHKLTKDIKPCTVNKSLNQIGAINTPPG